MPRTNSSTKTHIRALQTALATEGFTVNYTQARRIWDFTAATAAGAPSPAAELRAGLTPGAALLEAIRVVLRDQGAHVASAVDPELPLLDGHRGTPEFLPALGWEPRGDGSYTPCGPRIGTMAWDEDEGDWLIVLYSITAFEEVARRIPQLVPSAQNPAEAWQFVWEEHLTAPGRRRRTRGGVPESTTRVRMGDQQISGVPVLLSTLLSLGDAVATEDTVATAVATAEASTTPWTLVDAGSFAWNPVAHGNLLISGGTPADRNLVQSRLYWDVSTSDDVDLVRVNGVIGSGFDRALQRHREAVTSGTIPSRPLVVDVVMPLSELPLTYDGASVYHQVKHLTSAGAASNIFILARDDKPSSVLGKVEHALLGPFGHGTAGEMGLYEIPGFNRSSPGTAVVSYAP